MLKGIDPLLTADLLWVRKGVTRQLEARTIA